MAVLSVMNHEQKFHSFFTSTNLVSQFRLTSLNNYIYFQLSQIFYCIFQCDVFSELKELDNSIIFIWKTYRHYSKIYVRQTSSGVYSKANFFLYVLDSVVL